MRVLITGGAGFIGPFREDADLVLGQARQHRWAYACSEAIDEFLALAYWKEQKLPAIVMRFLNTGGPKQLDEILASVIDYFERRYCPNSFWSTVIVGPLFATTSEMVCRAIGRPPRKALTKPSVSHFGRS